MLTDRQREELHKAIADYLKQTGLNKSLSAFKEETETTGEEEAKYTNILEKKWITVLRLQKKVLDLQAQLSEVKDEVKEVNTTEGLMRRKDPTQWIPRPPAASLLNGHRSPVTNVVFHPTFSILVTASEDATIKLWDFESGDFERTLKGHTDSVNSIALQPGTGRFLASSSSDLTIKLWDFTTGDFECVKTLHGHDHNVSCVNFLNAELLVSSSRDKSIKIWAVESGYCVSTLEGHTDWVRRVVPSFDGNLLVSCSSDQSIKVWDVQKKEIKTDLRDHEHVVEDVRWANENSFQYIQKASDIDEKQCSGVNRYVVSCSRDKSIKFWDVNTSTLLFTLIGHDNWVRMLRFMPGGRYLISAADDKHIKVWDIENKRCQKSLLNCHDHFVSCIDVHIKGNRVASGSVDTKVAIWDCR